MEERHGAGQEGARSAVFQRKYLNYLGAVLRRVRIERATSVWARSRVVKLAADLSMAVTTRGGTEWSRAILGKYLFRLKKTHCPKRVFQCRGNSHGKRRSASVKTKPCKRTASSKKPVSQLPGAPSRSGTGIWSHSEEEGGTVALSMQSLRLLVPGSRQLDTPVFLEEAADYIVALKMQVQAMQALADCYTNSSAHAPFQVKE